MAQFLLTMMFALFAVKQVLGQFESDYYNFGEKEEDIRTWKMECGEGIVCGVLSLQSGLADASHKHNHPAVHGLFANSLDPALGGFDKVYPCAFVPEESHVRKFEPRELDEHSRRAGCFLIPYIVQYEY